MTMPRPGFVLDVDRSTPPTLFWRGEGFSLERLPPDRSRVIYAPEPLPAIDNIDGAIRHALDNPISADPLRALLFPGMKLTIAFDDVSLPLPKMRRPDVRQRVIEAVLDLAAEAGVDDVHLIAALALHRRMTEAELRHAVGDRVLRRVRPERPAVPVRRRGPRRRVVHRHHRPGRGGRDQQARGRVRPADLRQHQPRRHGRRLEVDRHRPRLVPLAAPPPQPDHDGSQPQLHGPAQERAAPLDDADGQGLPRRRHQGVPDRDDAEHRHVPEGVRVPVQARVGMDRERSGAVPRHRQVAVEAARRRRRARSSTRSRRRTR